ncbi:uncharacterized protein LOC127374294 isoform X2 [Dicentrarchus labrax]|uniref:uncharacterized protein LOC127374294 isoform X2 n=1 Tax=Dicentrarchus labrax TaxID=13489 RepID=UPI0021F58CF4|nr:uncharacterized protein LOC127374294 isoform X2 [Dicentrarchus labrax]
MILLWITLLLLHGVYALIPVTTVQLGESVTFTCLYPDLEYSNTRIKWYKQTFGDTLAIITTLMKATASPTFEQGFSSSRFNANHTETMSTLTILKTIEEDEALYHCGITTWSKDRWSATYLTFKGNNQRRTDYTVVQQPTVSDPVRPGDSVTLRCSVLSDSDDKACPGEHTVHWFGVRSDKSHASIIYTHGNSLDEWDRKPKASSSPKSCVYHFSKNVSSSDAGTYYCAVATCGSIIFGSGTKLDIEGTSLWSVDVLQKDSIILFVLCAVLAISVIVIAFLIFTIKKNKCDDCNDKAAVVSLQENVAKRNLKRDDTWIYSTAVFTMVKTGTGGTRDSKAGDRERIYTAIKALGLD